jgi:serine/threonine protein kinase
VLPDQPRLLANRYELHERIGTGGMGVVWSAKDLLLNREVAVKEVLPDHQSRMEREAQVGARVSHPNVVTVYDLVDEPDGPWLVMQLVPSRSLAAVVADDGPLSPRRAAAVGRHVLSALAAVHAQGILHCDVKPGNVLIDAEGTAHLTDFGIATDAGSRMTGTLIGAPAYIAPERARGLPMTPASDLWSLGATLYAAVEGRVPFDRGNALATVTAIATERPEPARNAGPLWPVLDGLLSADPALRPSTTEIDLMLRTVEQQQDATLVAATPLPPAPEPATRRSPAILVGAAVAALAIAGTLAFTAFDGANLKAGTSPAPPSAVAPVAEPTSAPGAETRDPAPVAYSSTAEPAATSAAAPSTVVPTAPPATTTPAAEIPPTTVDPPTSEGPPAPPSGP